MTKLLLNKGSLGCILVLLLVFGCDYTNPVDADTSGCPIEESCNYNPDAIDEESCWYPNDGCTCEDAEGSIVDECGVCNGSGVDIDNDGICDDVDDCVDLYLNDNCNDEEEVCVGCVDLTIINSSDIEIILYLSPAEFTFYQITEDECLESVGSWTGTNCLSLNCIEETTIATLDYTSNAYYLIPNVIESSTEQYCIFNDNTQQEYGLTNYFSLASENNYAFVLTENSNMEHIHILKINCNEDSEYECVED